MPPFNWMMPDKDVPDTLDRFVSRVLRREVFEAFAEQGQSLDQPYPLIVFGSAAIQVQRPEQGYWIRRLARDLDIGVIATDTNTRTDPDMAARKDIGKRVLEGIEAMGATIIEGSMKGVPGYDGLRITKEYNPEDIVRRAKGRLEEHDVIADLKGREKLVATLDVGQIVMRSNILPPVPLGEKGFLSTDIREVIAIKMMRLTSQQPVVRDMVDMYNVMTTPVPLVDVAKDKDVLRVMAVANISRNQGHRINTTFITGGDDAAKAVFEALFARSEQQLSYLTPEQKDERLERHFERSRMIASQVAGAFAQVFPTGIDRGGEFNMDLRTPLNLTDKEIRFGMMLRGVDKEPGSPHYAREQVPPGIHPEFLVPSEVEARFPDIRARLVRKHELLAVVERAVSRGL